MLVFYFFGLSLVVAAFIPTASIIEAVDGVIDPS
jgi:hypothetical protein